MTAYTILFDLCLFVLSASFCLITDDYYLQWGFLVEAWIMATLIRQQTG